MKLKKLLAAVTAAALAVSTMAVTSFTASAATANGTHTFASPDTFYYTDDDNKVDYKEYSLTQAQIGMAIGQPGVFVNGIESITINYEASDDISGVTIAHGSDQTNGYWAVESVAITSGTGTVTTQKPFSVTEGAVGFQIKVNEAATDLSDGKTLKINSVTLTGVEYGSEKIDTANFKFSTLTNTNMAVGDSFTIAYDSTGTPATAVYSIKYEWNDGTATRYGNAYYNGAIDNSNESVLGVKVTSAVSGNITTYTFTATGLSAYPFEVKIEASALGDFSDIQYLWFGSKTSYKVATDDIDTGEVSVTVTPATASVKAGETVQLTATVTGKDDAVVTWESTDTDIATVDENGLVTGVAKGSCEIRALVDGEFLETSTSFSVVTVTEESEPITPPAENKTHEGSTTVTCTDWWGEKDVTLAELIGDLDPAKTTIVFTGVKLIGYNSLSQEPAADGSTWRSIEAVNGKVTVDASDIDVENFGFKVGATGVESGNVEVTWVATENSSGTPVTPDPDPVTPPAATTIVLFEGTSAALNGSEGNALMIYDKMGAGLKAGDVLKVTYTINGDEYQQIAPKDGGSWTSLPSLGGTNVWVPLEAGSSTYTLTLSAADADIIDTTGLVFQGHNITIKKVEVIPKSSSTPSTPSTPSDPTPDDPSHTHAPAAVWSSDATNHWHACSGCTEKLDLAAHTSDDGTVTTPATATTTGTKEYKCTVCGYVMNTETIPATGSGNTPAPADPDHNYTGGVVIPVMNNNGTGSNTPVISGDSSKNGWDAIGEEALTASDGTKIEVNMNGSTKVPSSIFNAIKDKDVDIVFNMGRGLKWTVNGLSVTKASNIDFDFSKNTKHIPDEVVDAAEGSYKKQLSLDHNGNFGCAAVMTYDIGARYNGSYANLFYYNSKTKELELIDCSLISGGKASFVLTHASDYLITITEEPLGDFEDVSAASGISSDSTGANAAVFAAVLAVITSAFGVVVYKKRRHN